MEKKRKTTRPKTANGGKTYATDEVKRYLGSLSEEFQGRVAAIGEQFGGLDRKFDHMEVRFDGLNQKLDTHTEMIGGMKEDIEIIKANIEFLKTAVRSKVDYQDFAALEKRVRLVEAKLHR